MSASTTGPSKARTFRAVNGRILGDRGTAARRALLEALYEQLRSTGWREVRITEVARDANTSPATFYQYFTTLDEALTAVCKEVVGRGAPLPRHLEPVTHMLNRHSGTRKLPDPIALREAAAKRRTRELEAELAEVRTQLAEERAAGRLHTARAHAARGEQLAA